MCDTGHSIQLTVLFADSTNHLKLNCKNTLSGNHSGNPQKFHTWISHCILLHISAHSYCFKWVHTINMMRHASYCFQCVWAFKVQQHLCNITLLVLWCKLLSHLYIWGASVCVSCFILGHWHFTEEASNLMKEVSQVLSSFLCGSARLPAKYTKMPSQV